MHDLLTPYVNMLQTLVEIRLSLRLKRMLWLLRKLAMVTKEMQAGSRADVFVELDRTGLLNWFSTSHL